VYILRDSVYKVMYTVIQYNFVYLKRMHALLALKKAVLQVFFHLNFCYSAVQVRTVWDFTLLPHDISYNL